MPHPAPSGTSAAPQRRERLGPGSARCSYAVRGSINTGKTLGSWCRAWGHASRAYQVQEQYQELRSLASCSCSILSRSPLRKPPSPDPSPGLERSAPPGPPPAPSPACGATAGSTAAGRGERDTTGKGRAAPCDGGIQEQNGGGSGRCCRSWHAAAADSLIRYDSLLYREAARSASPSASASWYAFLSLAARIYFRLLRLAVVKEGRTACRQSGGGSTAAFAGLSGTGAKEAPSTMVSSCTGRLVVSSPCWSARCTPPCFSWHALLRLAAGWSSGWAEGGAFGSWCETLVG